MQIKEPKNTEKYYWTKHVYEKMKQYQLSEQVIKRVIRSPQRVEPGIAPGTAAAMQTRGQKRKTEIWTMYIKDYKKDQIKIITAWRYPGVSPIRKDLPIPDDILEELNKMDFNEKL
jgi:hypothetical protein